jgi:hypothetical protein
MNIQNAPRRAANEVRETAPTEAMQPSQQIVDAESALRRRMRLHPNENVKVSSHPGTEDPIPNEAAQPEETPATNARKARPIVSINGRDVDERSLIKHRSA